MYPYRTRNYCQMPVRRSLVNRSLDLRRKSVETAYFFKWSCINAVLTIVLGIDIILMNRSCCPKARYRLVYTGCILTAFFFLVCFIKYLRLAFENEPAVGTVAQKQLLDGMDNSGIDTILDLPNTDLPNKECKADRTFIIGTTTPLKRPAFIQKYTNNKAVRKHPVKILKDESPIACPEDFLTHPCQLPTLIRRAELEYRLFRENLQSPKPQTYASLEMSRQLKKTVYKLSPPPVHNRPITYEEFGTSHTQKACSDPARFSSLQMMQYVVNLRSWIQNTILKRLVSEIDFVNTVLQQQGFIGFEIGTMSQDTLRRTVEGQRIMLPALQTVLAFLNIAGDQRYLVKRLRELENSEFDSCNSGIRLPTDAAIIFHVFCVYLDSQLPPFPGYGPLFSTRYVIQRDPKQCINDIIQAVDNLPNFAILVTNNEDQRRPRFDYICGGELHTCADQRDSPFQVVIAFLMHMRQHQDSTLEGVSLGKGGINIMWVIGES